MRVNHSDYNLFSADDKIHRAAHSDCLSGNVPVGDAAFLVDLKRAKDSRVDMSAAYYSKGIRAVKIAAARLAGYAFSSGVDKLRDFFARLRGHTPTFRTPFSD